ncbi:MAG TPA: outer membrane beta-barrel protein, partial [Opitutaceae bacterium]
HHESHTSLTASLSTTWTVTSRFAVIGDASRDFSTAATDVSVDATTIGLSAQYSFNAKLVGFAGVNYGHVDFIDALSGGRRDDSISFDAGLTYTYSERLKVSATYTFTHNWSTFSVGNYDRHLFSINASSRW